MARTKSARRRKKIVVKRPGSLRKALGVKKGQKIPPSKMNAALRGRYGPKAKKRAQFKKNVLTGGRRRRRR